jgi:hypothetical protein
MLTIRSEQLRIFRESLLQQFEDKMMAHLQHRFAGWPAVGNEVKLRAMIRAGREIAAKFGITHEPDVRIFLEFMTEYGPDFHTLPWAAKILGDPTLSGAGKIEQLDSYSLFALRK